MKLLLCMMLLISLIFTFTGCAALTSYPPGYQPSVWETPYGPPDWYLDEADGLYPYRRFPPETVN